MKKQWVQFILTVFLVLGVTSGAQAILFTLDSFTVNAHNSGDGLLIETDPILGTPVSQDFTPGVPIGGVHLFEIWTDETTVNNGEDTEPKPITVDFVFSDPSAFGGAVSGETEGERGNLGPCPFCLRGFFQNGAVTWDGPAILNWGFEGGPLDGLFKITLSDETFNSGKFFGLKEGQRYGAVVKGKFEVTKVATPEPTSVLLLGSGILGVGLWRFRKAHKRSE